MTTTITAMTYPKKEDVREMTTIVMQTKGVEVKA
jgi:hypothetical protein